MGEGPNDWEWQVGLATHEWEATENPQLLTPGSRAVAA
jgi:hypothetical protein